MADAANHLSGLAHYKLAVGDDLVIKREGRQKIGKHTGLLNLRLYPGHGRLADFYGLAGYHPERQTIVLDKTGTLTQGQMEVTEVEWLRGPEAVEEGVDGDYPRYTLPEKEVKR